MISRWRSPLTAGVVIPDITVEAIKLTKTNLVEVMDWCKGRWGGTYKVLVPVWIVDGDANLRFTDTDGKTQYRDLGIVPSEKLAAEGDVVVKWGDKFYVVDAEIFESVYVKVP